MRFPCLLILLLAASGCASKRISEVAGQRLDLQGDAIEKIIRVEKQVEHTALLAPDGPREYFTVTCRYYIQKDGNPKKEFLIGNSRKNNFLCPFLAVSNSPLWVTFGETIIWNNHAEAAHIVHPAPGWPRDWPGPATPYTSCSVDDLDVYVFDPKGFFRHRTFMVLQKGEGKFLPEGQTYAAEFSFENGNRIVAFKSPKGPKKYDVLNDVVTDADQK